MRKPDSPTGDLLIIAIILTAALKFTSGLENALDIRLYDETLYLFRGVTLMDMGLPPAQNAPLYAIWYFVISRFQPDRINLYYLNYKLMVILPPVLIYILLRSNRVSIPTSFILSWFLLLSRAAYTWPRVSHFALIVTLSIFILVSHIRSPLWTSFFASFGALVVSYVRPEYFLAYLLLSLVFIALVLLEWRKQKKLHVTGLTVYTLISMVLLGVLGLPLSGNRDMVAFGQHFSRNWVSWTGSDLNPWTNWKDIVFQNFGAAPSVLEAFVNNPSVFLKHVTYNMWGLRNSFRLVVPVIFPTDKLSIGVAGLSFISLCLAYISNITRNFLEQRGLFTLIWLFLLPGVISAVVIYPREHYLLLPCVLTVVSMAILLGGRTLEQETSEPQAIQVNYKQLLLLGSFIIALTPYFGQVNTRRINLDTIRFIQSLRIEGPVNLLEAEGGYYVYLGNNFHRVAEYSKDVNFDRFLQMRNINMIVVSNTLLKDTRFRDDIEWYRFLAEYPSYGFLQMDIPHTERKLFVRAELLHK